MPERTHRKIAEGVANVAALGGSKPEYWSASLFKTPAGAFFLNEGNHQSQFAAEVEGRVTAGAKIVPLTDDAARAWGEANLSVGAVAVASASPTPDPPARARPPRRAPPWQQQAQK